MRILARSLLIFSALTLPVLSAHAVDYTFTPSLTDTTTLGNVSGTFGSGSGAFTFSDPPDNTYVDSLNIKANDNADGDEIEIDFAFTAPGTGTGTLTGDADIRGYYNYESGYIQWDSASDTVDLSNGSIVEILLPAYYNGDPMDTSLSSYYSCGSGYLCGSTDVTLKVTDNDPPDSPATTPEPSSLALLGTGIAGAAGMIRRKLKIA